MSYHVSKHFLVPGKYETIALNLEEMIYSEFKEFTAHFGSKIWTVYPTCLIFYWT